MPAHLVLDRVTARDHGRVVLGSLSLTLERGSILTLLGPAGAGKTALLMLLAGFLRATLGHVQLAGRDITEAAPHTRDTAMVFARDTLFPHLSVLDNVGFGLKMRGVARDERRRRGEAMLAALGIGHLGRLQPGRLDPAERRVAALARAAAVSPALLLVDKARDLAPALRLLAASGETTAILATQDRATAFALGDSVAVLNGGALAQVGAPREVFETPATRFVATITGGCNLLPATLLGHGAAGAIVQMRDATITARARPGLPAGKMLVCVRPHSVRLDPGGPVRGRVQSVSYQGALTQVTLALPSGPFLAELAQAPAGLAPGAELALGWDPADSWLLPADR